MIRRLLAIGAAGAMTAGLALVGPSAADTGADSAVSAEPDRIVLNPTPEPATSQSVTWRTAPDLGDGIVQLREAGSDDVQMVEADRTTRARLVVLAPAVHHTATLTDLKPGTRYEYRVGHDTTFSDWQEFETAPGGDEPWEFLYFGDAQNGLDTVWPQVTAAAYEAHPDARASVFAGDLINDSDQDVQWGHWFDAVGEQAREQQVIATPGNHEYFGDPTLQQYRAHFAFPDNGPLLRGEDVWYADHRGVRFVSLNGNAPLGGLDQAKWLDRVLRDNPNRWTVVTFHYPMFSFRAGRDNIATRTLWLPILEKHGVDLVLQGHDHGYARGHVEGDVEGDGAVGPTYVVSVAGSKYYAADGAEANNWTRNGARRVTALEQVSTYQSIRVEQDRLVYRSVAAAVGAEPTDGVQPGDVVDAFTVTKTGDGRPLVTDGM